MLNNVVIDQISLWLVKNFNSLAPIYIDTIFPLLINFEDVKI